MFQVRALASEKSSTLFRDVFLVILSSIFIGLCGQISIPLPFTPVPITVQNQLVLLLALFLGPRRAVASVLGFLAQGAMGLPVFAGAAGGMAILMGPRGGYLMGYVIAAWVTGYLMEKRRNRTILTTFWMMITGSAVILVCGCAYLTVFVGLKNALLLGVAPFVLGDVLKVIFCVKIFEMVRSKQFS